MSLPRHVNPSSDPALAPYNFVPLPEKVITVNPADLPDHDLDDPHRHTGWIDVQVTTKSPVYIRCPLTLEEFLRGEDERKQKQEHWTKQVRNLPDFYYADPDKTPRIPGSSLRGMLRSLVEIVAYSKPNAVSNRRLFYRAVGDTTNLGKKYRDRLMANGNASRTQRSERFAPKVKAGYMRKRGVDWYIQPAQSLEGVTFARMQRSDTPDFLSPLTPPVAENTERIYVEPRFYQDRLARVLRASASPGFGLIEAALVRSGKMPSKRTEAVIFAPDPDAPFIPLSDAAVRDYREQISPEQIELLGEKGVLHDGQPIFYLQEGDEVFFAHTMMMRLPYRHSPYDFLPKELRDESTLDFTEALFGCTKRRPEGAVSAYAGRVFVGDAVLLPDQPRASIMLGHGPLPSKILSGPKPTTFQHYLTQQQPDKQKTSAKSSEHRLLANYDTSPSSTTLRGFKLYWHKGDASVDEIQEDLNKLKDRSGRWIDGDTQHTFIWPVAAGVRFQFRIHFENLSSEELGALLWVLTLPGAEGRQYCHSIGMGKPHGMGAIQLEPSLYLESRAAHYQTLFAEDGAWSAAFRPAAGTEIEALVQVFDQYVRSEIGARQKSSLAQEERIAMLLKLLEWPGPDPTLTRYLSIEQNEYKDRPVLPDSLHVESHGAARVTTFGRQAPPPKLVVPVQKQSVSQSESMHAAAAHKPQQDVSVEGRVVRIDFNRIVVEVNGKEGTLLFQEAQPQPADREDAEALYPVGSTVRAREKKHDKKHNKKGRLQLTMRQK